MHFRKNLIAIVLCLYYIGSIDLTLANSGDNIALNKRYTFNKQPNYALCTNDGDLTDLTDGKYSKGDGSLWVQPSTVGWQNRSPIITIDLEEVKSISGVSYSTAAGTAGVNWPAAILIFVSENNKEYYYVGDLIELSSLNGLPKAQGYSTHRYKTCSLKTWGRYVRLMVIPKGSYTFCDEIEVYEGPKDNLQFVPGEIVINMDELVKQRQVENGIIGRILADIKEMENLIDSATASENIRMELSAELTQIKEGIKLLSAPQEDFKAIIPLNPLHERLFELRAKLLRMEGYPELFVWENCRWDMLAPFDIPNKDVIGVVNLQMSMMRNEYRSEAFNISNFSDQSLVAKVKIEGLPSGSNPDYISVHQVEYVDTRDGVVVSAALPLAKRVQDGYEISLPAGITRQVWLTFNPQKVSPGTYRGRISVEILYETYNIPLELIIYGLDFPQKPTLSLGMWDYSDRCLYDMTLDNRMAAIDDMRAHYVNTPWASSSTAPWPSAITKIDDEYKMEMDFSDFDYWVELWNGSENYAVFLNVGNTFGPQKTNMGTDEFNKMVSLWAKLWGQHIKDIGLHPSQFLLLLVDEPKTQEQINRIVTWAQAIKAGDSDFIIWEDPVFLEPWTVDLAFFEVVDTICPNLNKYYQAGVRCSDFYEALKQQGKNLWFYQCSGPARLLDPYYYYRLLPWHAWERGAVGVGFWAYGDSGGGDSWNEYQAKSGTSYTPVYLGQSSITSGKHWEAIREGVQDYEYLKILKDLIVELKMRGLEGDEISQAEWLLEEASQRVIGIFSLSLNKWEEHNERSVADQERLRILESIQQLQSLIE